MLIFSQNSVNLSPKFTALKD